ncbi:hypothetical protein TNCV_1766131 [Trichonephila clavipes]|nr:hypothetical protein TNCV_1766131 [Trichonephila clavipes]
MAYGGRLMPRHLGQRSLPNNAVLPLLPVDLFEIPNLSENMPRNKTFDHSNYSNHEVESGTERGPVGPYPKTFLCVTSVLFVIFKLK